MREGCLPCLLPASRSTTFPISSSFSQHLDFYFPICKALETKVVDESCNGNCPVCVDPFQIGDQVLHCCFYPRLFKTFGILIWKSLLQLLLPGCNASNQHACHPACLQGWLARLKTAVTSLSSFFASPLTPFGIFRHSTCPVCRQTLAIEEDEEGYDGGDESDDGPNEED